MQKYAQRSASTLGEDIGQASGRSTWHSWDFAGVVETVPRRQTVLI